MPSQSKSPQLVDTAINKIAAGLELLVLCVFLGLGITLALTMWQHHHYPLEAAIPTIILIALPARLLILNRNKVVAKGKDFTDLYVLLHRKF